MDCLGNNSSHMAQPRTKFLHSVCFYLSINHLFFLIRSSFNCLNSSSVSIPSSFSFANLRNSSAIEID